MPVLHPLEREISIERLPGESIVNWALRCADARRPRDEARIRARLLLMEKLHLQRHWPLDVQESFTCCKICGWWSRNRGYLLGWSAGRSGGIVVRYNPYCNGRTCKAHHKRWAQLWGFGSPESRGVAIIRRNQC